MMRLFTLVALVVLLTACGGSNSQSDISATDGQNGSTSAFIVQRGFLVVLNSSARITVYDISADKPAPVSVYNSTAVVETLFRYGDDLIFMGAEAGSTILQISADGQLKELSFTRHANSCDPVVANGKLMFVTLRSGTRCQLNGENRLQVYDISNLNNPWLLGSLPLPEPHGLALQDDKVFVCTAEGLQVVDVSDSANPKATDLYRDVPCSDLIVRDRELVLSGKDKIILANSSDLPLVSASVNKGE